MNALKLRGVGNGNQILEATMPVYVIPHVILYTATLGVNIKKKHTLHSRLGYLLSE